MGCVDGTKGTDALVLGAMPSDEVSIHEMEAPGQATFVAEIRINLFQKRLRVSGVVGVDFIARGTIYSHRSALRFAQTPSFQAEYGTFRLHRRRMLRWWGCGESSLIW